MGIRTKKINLDNAFILMLLMLLIGFALGHRSDYIINQVTSLVNHGSVNKTKISYEALDNIYHKLNQTYDGNIDQRKIIEGASKGMVAALGDPHTVYFNPTEAKEFAESLSGNIGAGIGAEIGYRSGNIVIVRPLKDNPAFEAGLLAGDIITKVNDKSIAGQGLDQVVLKIRGKEGTKVKLTIVRKGVPDLIDIEITRAIIKNPSVVMEYNKTTAVIQVSRFDKNTNSLIRQKVEQLKKDGKNSVIIDLRGNPGGYLNAAQKVASLWIEGELVVTEKNNKDSIRQFFADSGDSELKDFKTIVLVNGGSASASEILAAALRFYNQATIIGEKTFGKGSVQQLMQLPFGGQLKVTIARWYTPENKNIDHEGVIPDVEIKLSPEDWQNGNDTQLNKALELLKQK